MNGSYDKLLTEKYENKQYNKKLILRLRLNYTLISFFYKNLTLEFYNDSFF
ncbi:hypothetical protein LEP1GSC173_2716 [Leptospira interrogans str. HAI1594]|nr:hypothetical protein LEP1GSC173_2716 [Leptospira interrogans str. HAI1594]